MGEILKLNLSARYYFIGFTSYNGLLGKVIFPIKLKMPSRNSLEWIFNRAGQDYAFLDFRNKDLKTVLQPSIEARPFGFKNIFMNVTEVMDGIIYIKTTYPSVWIPVTK